MGLSNGTSDDIRITSTEKFNAFIESLDKLNETLEKIEKRIQGIKDSIDYDPTGEITELFNSYVKPMNDNIKTLKESIANLKQTMTSSLEYYINADNKTKKDIEESFNKCFLELDSYVSDINKVSSSIFGNDDKELTEEEKDSLILSICFSNIDKLSNDAVISLMNESEYLTEEDKKYINEQAAKGNFRACVGYIIVKQSEETLKVLNDEKTSLEHQIGSIKGKGMLAFYEDHPNEDGIPTEDEIMAYLSDEDAGTWEMLSGQLSAVKVRINDQKLVNYQYKTSLHEWEYDYVLELAKEEGTTSRDMDFYSDALKFFYGKSRLPEKYGLDNLGADYFSFEDFHTVMDGEFTAWLKSSECDLDNETKTYYLEKIKTLNSTEEASYYCDSELYMLSLAGQKLMYSGYADENLLFQRHCETKESENPFSLLPENNLFDKACTYFDDEHMNAFKYILINEGAEAADKYLDTFSDYFNKCSAFERSTGIVDRIMHGEEISGALGDFVAFGEGTPIGIENWFESVGNMFSKDGKMTESEYTIMYVNSILGGLCGLAGAKDEELKQMGITKEQRDAILAKYNWASDGEGWNMSQLRAKSTFGKSRSDWLKLFFGAGETTGNMVPSVVASYATGGALSELGVAASTANKWGKVAGLGAMFLSCCSSSKNAALRDGRSQANAWTYGILSGTSEVFTEYLLGGTQGLSAHANPLKLTGATGWRAAGLIALNTFVISPLEEIGEEELQLLVLDPLAYQFSFGEKKEGVTTDDILDTAVQTYFSTVGLNSVTYAPNATGNYIGSNTVVGTYSFFNDESYNITYGELLECIDPETGILSDEKMANILSDITISDEMIELSVEVVKNLKIEGLSTAYYDPESNGYVLKFESGIIKKVSDLSEVSNYNPMDIDFSIEKSTDGQLQMFNETISQLLLNRSDGKYTQEQLEDFLKMLDTSIPESLRVEYSPEQIEMVMQELETLKQKVKMPQAIDYLSEFFENEMKKGNPNIKGTFLTIMSSFDQEFKGVFQNLDIEEKDNRSFFNTLHKTIYFRNGSSTLSLLHELEHAAHYIFDTVERKWVNIEKDGTRHESLFSKDVGNFPEYNAVDGNYYINGYNYSEIIKNLRESNLLKNFKDFDKIKEEAIYAKAMEMLQADINESGKTEDEFFASGEAYVRNQFSNGDPNGIISSLMTSMGLDITNIEMTDELIRQIAINGSLQTRLAAAQDSISNLTDTYGKFSDVVDAIYGGESGLLTSHGKNYYGGLDLNTYENSGGIMSQWNEILAQFQTLRAASPKFESLTYELFGKDFCDMIYGELDLIEKRAIDRLNGHNVFGGENE